MTRRNFAEVLTAVIPGARLAAGAKVPGVESPAASPVGLHSTTARVNESE